MRSLEGSVWVLEHLLAKLVQFMLKLFLRYSNYLNTGDIDPNVIPETERILTSRRRGDYEQTLPTNLDWSLTGNITYY